MNEHFVSIKVDREERPDLDAIYMDAVETLTGHGGWPLTVFLTPDGEPFYGGTYFPPEPLTAAGFARCSRQSSSAYRERRGGGRRARPAQLVEAIGRAGRRAPTRSRTEVLVGEAVRVLARRSTRNRAGSVARRSSRSTGARVPAAARRDGAGRADARQDGGRRHLRPRRRRLPPLLIDERWLVPHFEKMLYDNASSSRRPRRRRSVRPPALPRVAERDARVPAARPMLAEGGFASSQDADTEGEEGRPTRGRGTRPRSIRKQLAEIAARLWGVSAEGNFEGATVLSRVSNPAEAGARSRHAREPAGAPARGPRATRAQPALDDKALASWNGMALAALARAGAALRARRPLRGQRAAHSGFPARAALARRRRTLAHATAPGAAQVPRLPRRPRAGRQRPAPSCTAQPASGAGWTRRAASRGSRSSASCDEARGGFFDTASDAERLVARTQGRRGQPDSPSGTSTLAYVLLRLARIYGDDELERHAVSRPAARPRSRAARARRVRLGAVRARPPLLAAARDRDRRLAGRRGREAPRSRGYDPNAVVAFGPSEDVPLLQGKALVDGKPAVYVCERFACQAPVTDPDAFDI